MLNFSAGETANLAVQSLLQFIARENEEREEKYRIYREYYEGIHRQQLTDEMRDYLRVRVPGMDFSANYIPIVVDSIANRVTVVGFECGNMTDEVMQWWEDAEMDAKQTDVHTSAFRDGDSYLLVQWDNELGQPRFYPHMAYDGNSGVHMEYDSETGKPTLAIKRWTEMLGPGQGSRRRAYVYFPNRVVSLATGLSDFDGGWEVVEERPWPLGEIPVVHFKNRGRGYNYGLSEMEQAIPMQDALNKSIIAQISAMMQGGFRIITWTGNEPGDVAIRPGGILYDPNPDVKIGFIPSADLRPMIETVDSFVQRIGQVSDTPLSYFQLSGQMASEGTHKQHEARLIAKARVATTELGNSWAQAIKIACNMATLHAGAPALESKRVNVIWDTLEVRDSSQRLTEKFERLKLAVDAGANFEAAARLAGFTEQEAKDLAEVDYQDVREATFGIPAVNPGAGQEVFGNNPSGS